MAKKASNSLLKNGVYKRTGKLRSRDVWGEVHVILSVNLDEEIWDNYTNNFLIKMEWTLLWLVREVISVRIGIRALDRRP
jgi:hypothetical protein